MSRHREIAKPPTMLEALLRLIGIGGRREDVVMPLYVWMDPYPVRYGSSVVAARGRTVDEARERASKAVVSRFGFPPEGSIEAKNHDLSDEPSFVLSDDEAICFEWME